jgi:hypothetical protein
MFKKKIVFAKIVNFLEKHRVIIKQFLEDQLPIFHALQKYTEKRAFAYQP